MIEWLKRLNLNVPQDVGVVAIGTAEMGGKISGIDESTRKSGELAMEILVGRVQKGELGGYADPHHLTIGGEWNRGQTLNYCI